MIPADLAQALAAGGVAYCLIGAQALAVWGVARFTAGVDLLTMDARVLARSFWPPELADRIAALRRGDDEDPLAGLVRFRRPAPVDLIVGRGKVMRDAVQTAALDPHHGVPVAEPVALALLKLEAGGPQDLADLVRLADARRVLAPEVPFVARVEARVGDLSPWGLRAWARVRPDLVEATAP